MDFLDSGGLWFLFIVEVLPSGWGWTIGLSMFPGYGSLCRCSGGLWFLFIVEVSPSGWGWTIGLSRFPV